MAARARSESVTERRSSARAWSIGLGRPQRALALLAACLLLGGAALVLGQDFEQPARWTEAIEPVPIADRLFDVGSADLTAFLLTSDEGHILIDAPLEENVELVLDNIRKLGFDPKDVKVQLASHAHFDHTGGIASMLEATGAELVLSEEAAKLVARGGRGDFFLGDDSGYAEAQADRTVRHLDTVTVGDVTLTAHLTPGHTKGCTSWSGTVTIDGEPVDFVSICSLSVLDGYQLVGNGESYPGIGRDFCASVAHLRSLEPDLFLASHGSFLGMARKIRALEAGDRRAFVDPEGYRSYLDRAQRRIEATLAEQGEPGGCAAVLDEP